MRCGLHFGEETYSAGRPLIDYTAEPVNRIEYRCLGCSALGRDPVEDFVRLLMALRTGDGNTPITKAAAALKTQCASCQSEQGWTVKAFEPKPFYERSAWEVREAKRQRHRVLIPPTRR